jgi:threonine/homoserine/homoserine lactone efflux protein
VTNPKGAVFFAAVLPQFVDHGAGNIQAQLLALELVFVVIALLCDACWTMLAGAARGWFGRSPRRAELVGGAGGLAMVGRGSPSRSSDGRTSGVSGK